MSMRRRRGGGVGAEAWPGYVDALSTLLMVVIFVLLVFVLAQAFLSVALSRRNAALEKVNQTLAQVSQALSLEKGKASKLELAVSQLNEQLSGSRAAQASLTQQLAVLHDEIAKAAVAQAALKSQLKGAETQAAANATQASKVSDQLAAAKRQLAEMRAAEAALNQTVTVDKATIQAKLADLAQLAQEVAGLKALRDQLQQQAVAAAARATTTAQKNAALTALLAKEKDLGASAAAQIALLNQQVDQMRAQIAAVSKALDIAKQQGRDKDVEIANLGTRLNAALAAKVQELQQYRSEFFGELRKILAGVPGVHVVGDRFVISSDVLFPVGSADLSAPGVIEVSKVAELVKRITAKIPPKINWVLDVEGYADRQPFVGGSNWQLSTERAISVVRLLIAEGVPAPHLAATGYGDNHPIDPGDTQAAFARNRRIELRLTDYGKTHTS
ncbi:MAG: peptidoglycan -binding protein [Rhodospirillales bacterium]|jgi:chemotaxis protein MotB|nr:peptidoglycan -binding protein [Rhodospirillales bacterium]